MALLQVVLLDANRARPSICTMTCDGALPADRTMAMPTKPSLPNYAGFTAHACRILGNDGANAGRREIGILNLLVGSIQDIADLEIRPLKLRRQQREVRS